MKWREAGARYKGALSRRTRHRPLFKAPPSRARSAERSEGTLDGGANFWGDGGAAGQGRTPDANGAADETLTGRLYQFSVPLLPKPQSYGLCLSEFLKVPGFRRNGS